MVNRFRKIAVVGHACRFPGGADTPDAFWQLLADGRDAVTTVPADRFDQRRFLHSDPAQQGKTYTFAAGTLGDVGAFDAGFFGISPREAQQMDPQQRLLLELTWEAFERAGLVPARLAGSNCAVYIGISGADYSERRMGDLDGIGPYFMLGSTLSIAANRISYVFDLRGPSMSIDTACSSSLVALNEAVHALQDGRAGMAVVGGINLLLSPAPFIGFARARMLSVDGRCRAFSKDADGYVRAEGGGILVLKPLEEALRDKDPVVAVIRGSGVNTDGRTHGIALPSTQSQEALLRNVYRKAGIKPRDVSYFEAHGTGTPVGDPAEAAAIGRSIGMRRPKSRPLPIGSVKSNIGHLEPASGIAGVIKAIEILRHGVVPPSLHLEELNPDIAFHALNIAPVRTAARLERHGEHAVIGINSFGFGGTNAHVILESYDPHGEDRAAETDKMLPLILSGRSEVALRGTVRKLCCALENAPAIAWRDLAYSAACRRSHHEHRLMLKAKNVSDALQGLEAWEGSGGKSQAVTALGVKLALVFVGNGAQWPGMGQRLLKEDAVFRDTIAKVDACARWRLGWSISAVLESGHADIADTRIVQPLLFAIQVGIVESLKARGLTVGAVVGHSVGEIAAAYIAGALTLEQAARVIRERSEAQHKSKGAGRMMTAAVTPHEAEKAIARHDPRVEIAAINGPRSVTLTGPEEALTVLHEDFRAGGVAARMLNLDYPFHSAAQDAARDKLLESLSGLAPTETNLPFYSTVTAGRIAGTLLGNDYWWRNMRQPVRLSETIAAMARDGFGLFLEVGPEPLLQANIRQSARNVQALPSLSRAQDGAEALELVLERTFLQGAAIDFEKQFPDGGRLVAMPTYPWQRERHWFEQTSESSSSLLNPQDAPLLGMRVAPQLTVWENHFDTKRFPFLADHVVGGAVMVPAAVFVEMALEAAAITLGEGGVEIEDLEIQRPMILEKGQGRMVRFTLSPEGGFFRIESRERLSGASWSQHAAGRIAALSRMPAATVPQIEGDIITADAHYAAATKLGFAYGPAFQVVESTRCDGHGLGVALLTPPVAPAVQFRLNPILLDGLLQLVLPAVLGRAPKGKLYVPHKIARLSFQPGQETTGPWRAYVRRLRGDANTLLANCQLRDASGRLIAELKTARFVPLPVPGAAASNALRFETIIEPLAALDEQAVPSGPMQQAGAAVVRALADIQDHAAPLNEIASAFAAETLLVLGTETQIGPEHQALLARVIAAAEHHAQWGMDAGALWRKALVSHPALGAELNMVGRAGLNLRARLEGMEAAAASDATLAHLFDNAPVLGAGNGILEQAVRAFVASWPKDRRLRVLEIGAGFGGFSNRVWEALKDVDRDLTLSDADPARVAALAERFDCDSITLDLAKAEGLPETHYDLIVGAYVLRGFGDDALALRNLSRLAASGAALLFVETAPSPWSGLVFPGHSQASLAPLLEASGCVEVHSHAAAGVELVRAVAGRAALQKGARLAAMPWLVVAAPEDMNLAEALTSKLAHAGHGAEVLPLAREESWSGPWRARWERVGADRIAVSGLIVLPGSHPGAIVSALKSLNITDPSLCPARMVLVTRCAVAAGNTSLPDQAGMLGLGRVLQNEMPQMPCRIIDLNIPDDEAAARLCPEILAVTGESEVLLRPGGRFATRLRPVSDCLPPASAHELEKLHAPGGSLEQLRWMRAPRRAPDAEEVEIEVRAAGLNFRDVMFAMGALPAEILESGFAGAALGMEAAGIVTRVGKDVQDLAPGDHVACYAPSSLASHLVTKRFAVSKLPVGIGFAEGATMIVPFFTVVYGLAHLARLQAGERVLIHGAAGGVGLAAIQYARHCGAEIFCTAGSAEKREFLRLIGVAEDHILDSRTQDFAASIRALTNDEGVDVILNSLAGEAMHRGLSLLRPFGRFIELGKADFVANSRIGLRALRNNIAYHGVDADQLMVARPDVASAVFREAAALFAAGAFSPLPFRIFPKDRVVDAFRLMQRAQHIGKIVIAPGLEAVSKSASEIQLDPDAHYLVTGGLTGFGLASAQWLAARGARHLALAGRTGRPGPEAETALTALRDAGVAVALHACDMRDEASVAKLVAALADDKTPLKGIIHAATTYDDCLLADLTQERWDSVWAAKAMGALWLHKASSNLKLDFFLLYSSISAMVGNIGQANYVGANLYLESLAALRRSQGLAATVVALGPIAQTGQLARHEVLAAGLEKIGLKPMHPAALFRELDQILFAGGRGSLIVDANWARLEAMLPALKSPKFQALMRRGDADDGMVQGGGIREMITSLGPDEVLELLNRHINQAVSQILDIPVERLDPGKSIFELGMDSLMGLELSMTIEQKFGVALSPMLLSQDIGPRRLAEIIRDQLLGQDPSGAAPIDAAQAERREIMVHHSESVDAETIEKALKHIQTTPHVRLIS